MTRLVLTAALLLTAGVATAADPVPPTDTQVLSQTLRDLLLLHLPEPLVSSAPGPAGKLTSHIPSAPGGRAPCRSP